MVDKSSEVLKTGLFGNPHSNSASSLLATAHVNRARRRVLQFFRADPRHFDVVFVANATAAIKLVGYSFQDYGNSHGFWYGYHIDAHTSLVGVRELAQSGSHCFDSDKEFEQWLDAMPKMSSSSKKEASEYEAFSTHVESVSTMSVPPFEEDVLALTSHNQAVKLVGYPAQSNMNGRRAPKNWARRVREAGESTGQKIYTLLDAAAYCSSAQLDLSDADSAPDFTALSFYKIFGMPDLGALIVRKASSDILTSRRYFGGGTVGMVVTYGNGWHAMKSEIIHDILEDGTLPFHSLIMLELGISTHQRLFHSMDAISKHATQLADELYLRLSQMHHANGHAVCEIYKSSDSVYGDSRTQGPTIAFNVRRANGSLIPVEQFEAMANACNIQIRTGGVCNPGGIAAHLQLDAWEMRRNYFEGFRCGEPFKIRGGKPVGIIRASLGAMSSRTDVDIFVAFLKRFFMEAYTSKPAKAISLRGSHNVWSVQQLKIFPVRYCGGWKVPTHQYWDLEDSRPALDGDWCLVDLIAGKVITDMALTMRLNMEVQLESGFLRISVHKPQLSATAALEIPLWEFPSGDWVADSLELTVTSTQKLARQYAADEVSAFLTSALGRPCTLARFYEFTDCNLPIDSDNRQFRIAVDGIKVQFGLGEIPSVDSSAHVVLISNGFADHKSRPECVQIGSQQLVRIEDHRESVRLSSDPLVFQYRRLPDTEESMASQNTAIHSGDLAKSYVQAITTDIDFTPYIFCPVADCSMKYTTYPAPADHMRAHAADFLNREDGKTRRWKGLLGCF
jgi:molybdenum cofactor sulfurtransferase